MDISIRADSSYLSLKKTDTTTECKVTSSELHGGAAVIERAQDSHWSSPSPCGPGLSEHVPQPQTEAAVEPVARRTVVGEHE